MIPQLEKFISDKFNQMPLAVRVFTYLFILFLFAYLILIPQFINGEFVYKTEYGGTVPYRGGDIKMFVDGRCLKFKTNQDGYWSIPIVSKLPVTVQAKFYHVDADIWFLATFTPSNYWTTKHFKVEISDDPPQINVVTQVSHFGNIKIAFENFLNLCQSTVWAGSLNLPTDIDSKEIENVNRETISNGIINIVKEKTGLSSIDLPPTFRLTSQLRYTQQIEILYAVENRYSIRIPDEHWSYLVTIRELTEYVINRVIIEKSKKHDYWNNNINQNEQPSSNAPPILPDSTNRPIFTR